MSFFGSPVSNSFNNHEYDFDDEKLENDEDKELEEHPEESDEDTEDASETDTGILILCFTLNCLHDRNTYK